MALAREPLADIQREAPEVALALERVGVRGLVFPLRLRDRANGIQTVTATAALAVDLPPDRRGTHMSRFVETLDAWQEELGCQSVRSLLESLRTRLDSSYAWARFEFSYLMRRYAPTGPYGAGMAFNCSVTASLRESLAFTLGIEAPVMTVCPCSLAICREGAHSQRALVSMKVHIEHFIWLEELIELAESSASSPVYPLLKRADEKHVTEAAFAHPAFVEDVARNVAQGLHAFPGVLDFEVEVESMESIHNHDAFAYISSGKP